MPQKRSDMLDIIRAIAISMVVSFHYFPNRLTYIGWTGVNLFFILSGFLITGILIDNREADNYYLTFYARRVFRIVPLYGIDVALFALVVGLDQPLWHYAMFIQNFTWIARGAVRLDWMAPTWSLAVEEQFYLLLPLIVRLTEIRRLPYIAGSAILAAPAYRLFMTQALGTDWPVATQTLPGSLDSLFLGVLIAWAVRAPSALARLQQRRYCLWGMSGIGLAGTVVLFSDTPAPTSWMGSVSISWIALTYALVFAALVTRPHTLLPKKRSALCWLGVGAYSIYLFHMPVAFGTEMLFSASGAAHLVALPILVAIAVACWYGIEGPLISAAGHCWRYQAHSAEIRQNARSGVRQRNATDTQATVRVQKPLNCAPVSEPATPAVTS